MKTKYTLQLTALTSVAVLAASSALADARDPGAFYTGLGYGQCTTDFKDPSRFTGTVDDDVDCYALLVGWDHGRSERFYYEFEYRKYDKTRFDGTFDGVPDTGTIEADTIGLFVGYAYPLNEQFSVGGRVGVVREDVEEKEVFGGVPETNSGSGTEPAFGVRVRWRPSPSWLIQLAWDRQMDLGEEGKTGEGDADGFMLTGAYRFGNVAHH